MREKLGLTIEAISIFTAVGVVVSVLIYTYVFGLYGVSYISIAALSDMLRDSMQVLIWGIVFLLAAIVIFSMVEIAHRYTDFEGTRPRSAVFWKAFRYGVGSGIAFAVILHVSQVMTNHTYHFSFSWIMLVIHLLQTAIMVCLFYYIFGRDHGFWGEHLRRTRFLPITPGNLWFWSVVFILSSVWSVYQQMEKGIDADVYPVDKTLCKGRYTVIWLGDSRMVAKCEAGQQIVVKMLD